MTAAAVGRTEHLAGASGATTATGSFAKSPGLSDKTRYAIKTALSLTLAYLLPTAQRSPSRTGDGAPLPVPKHGLAAF